MWTLFNITNFNASHHLTLFLEEANLIVYLVIFSRSSWLPNGNTLESLLSYFTNNVFIFLRCKIRYIDFHSLFLLTLLMFNFRFNRRLRFLDTLLLLRQTIILWKILIHNSILLIFFSKWSSNFQIMNIRLRMIFTFLIPSLKAIFINVLIYVLALLS